MIVLRREVFGFLSVLEAGNYIYHEIEFFSAGDELFLVFGQRRM